MELFGSNVSPFALTLKRNCTIFKGIRTPSGYVSIIMIEFVRIYRGTKDVENMKSYRKT